MDLYPETACKVCGATHDLCFTGDTAPPAAAAYAYDCPATGTPVFFRPASPPKPVDAAPAGAVPLRWVAN